jgi:hypothetical protein
VSGSLRRRLEAEAERQGASLNARAAEALELGLSLDDELQNRISEATAASGRDIASEIVNRVRQSFEPDRVSLVATPRIYAELRAAAALNRRSFEEEAAHRLRKSFTFEFDLFPNAAPSPLIRRAVHQLVDVLGAIEVFTGRKFGVDPWVHRQAAIAMAAWFQVTTPIQYGPQQPPTGTTPGLPPLPTELIDRFGELLVLAFAFDDPEWYGDIARKFSIADLQLRPADPRLAIPPGHGSALLQQGRDPAVFADKDWVGEELERSTRQAQRDQRERAPIQARLAEIAAAADPDYAPEPVDEAALAQAQARAVERLRSELADSWRFADGEWFRRQPDSERWVVEGVFEIFNKARLACRAVANAITREGGDAAVARKMSSYEIAAIVELLAARALQAAQDDTPPAAAESAEPVAAPPPPRRKRRGRRRTP